MKPLHLLKNISNMINHVLIIFLPIGHNNCSQNKTSLPEHEAKRQNKRKKKKENNLWKFSFAPVSHDEDYQVDTLDSTA